MWKRKNLVDRYTVLRAASLPKIKKNLADKESSFLRADFQMKREFFTEVLNTGYSTEGTLYELFQLGDKNEDNLWWLML